MSSSHTVFCHLPLKRWAITCTYSHFNPSCFGSQVVVNSVSKHCGWNWQALITQWPAESPVGFTAPCYSMFVQGLVTINANHGGKKKKYQWTIACSSKQQCFWGDEVSSVYFLTLQSELGQMYRFIDLVMFVSVSLTSLLLILSQLDCCAFSEKK